MRKKLIFFGAGEVCRHSVGYATAMHLQVDYVVDNSPTKWGTVCHGLLVLSPKELKEKMADEEYEIIITVGPQASGIISGQLQEMGFVYGQDFLTFYDKFFGGMIPTAIYHGSYYTGDGDFTLLKTITDQVLLTDSEHRYVYRAVKPEKEAGLRQVYEKVRNSEKLRQYIVETTLSDNEILNCEYPLVFQHEYLPLVTYLSEWSPVMLRDYVLFMLEFLAELDKEGLGLQDPGTLNTTFCNGKFMYIDYSGLWWQKTNWYIMRTLIEMHINALILVIKNQSKGYMYLTNANMVVKYADIVGYMDNEENKQYQRLIRDCEKLVCDGNVLDACQILKDYVEDITVGFSSLSDWTGYQDDLYSNRQTDQHYTRKQAEVLSLVRSVKPRTIMDLAGNMGWYSLALSGEVDYAVTLDIDSGISDCAYQMIQQTGVKNVYPLYANAMRPQTSGFMQRTRCDMVMALAVIHHLALTQGLTFEQILDMMGMYTNRYLLIEFVSPEDPYATQYLRQFDSESIAWYTQVRFERALTERFAILERRPSEVPTRTLYLCERR